MLFGVIINIDGFRRVAQYLVIGVKLGFAAWRPWDKSRAFPRGNRVADVKVEHIAPKHDVRRIFAFHAYQLLLELVLDI